MTFKGKIEDAVAEAKKIKSTVADIKDLEKAAEKTVRDVANVAKAVFGNPVKVPAVPASGGAVSAKAKGAPASLSAFQILANSRYHVAIDGVEYAAFSEISGLQIETETMDFIEGGVNDRVLRLPVRSKVGNITLKRGVTAGNELLNWHLQIVQGYLELKNVTIYVYQTNGKLLTRYELLQAYPVKWTGPQMMGSGEAVAVETIELAHAGFIQVST